MVELDYEYLSGLVKKAQKGSSDAFAEIYAATYQKQYRFTYRYVKDAYLAQDVLQEVYILALKNLHKLKDPRLFVSWLNQINFRVCFNTCKRRRTESEQLNEQDVFQIVDESGNDNGSDPEGQITQKLEYEELMEKVLSLPSNESQAIIMKYYNDMKLEEIADAMCCSRSTVKRYLAGGREKLERLLDIQKGGAGIE